MQRLAARQQRLDAHHPERRNGQDQARQAARNPQLGENQAAVSDPQDEYAAEADGTQFAPARQRSPRIAIAVNSSEPEIT